MIPADREELGAAATIPAPPPVEDDADATEPDFLDAVALFAATAPEALVP